MLAGIGWAAVLAAVFINSAKATPVSFDGAPGGIFLDEAVDLKPAALAPSVVSVVAGARIYDFKSLYRGLGYPSADYFGATEDEVSDLEVYTSKGDTFYKEINDYLRFHPNPYTWYGTSPEAAESIVKNLDRIFDRVPVLPGDIVLFRGLDLKFRNNQNFEIGEEFSDKGYVSTSASFKVARYFAIEKNDNAHSSSLKAIFAVYFERPGEKGILIDANEDEVILRRGRNFRVMAKKGNTKKYDLYLVQACSGACETSLRVEVQYFWTSFNPQD